MHPVPRYYFNVHDGVDIIDKDGTELPDMAAVRREAVLSAGLAIRDMGLQFWGHGDWRMDVLDESGNTVLTLKFSGTSA